MSFLVTEVHWKLLKVSYTSMIYSLIDILCYMYPYQHTFQWLYFSHCILSLRGKRRVFVKAIP